MPSPPDESLQAGEKRQAAPGLTQLQLRTPAATPRVRQESAGPRCLVSTCHSLKVGPGSRAEYVE
eukprot:11041966-Alexandrium_andersonii.AAC.1